MPETEGLPVLGGSVCSGRFPSRSGRSTRRLELHPKNRILIKTEKVENMFTVPALVSLDTRGAADEEEMSKGRLQVAVGDTEATIVAIEVDSHGIDNGGHANYEHVRGYAGVSLALPCQTSSGWSALHNELVDPYGRL